VQVLQLEIDKHCCAVILCEGYEELLFFAF